MEHVLGKTPALSECLFEPPGAAIQDLAHLLLYRDELTVVLLNRYPYANGHLLVAPRRHLADLTELTAEENSRIMAMLTTCCTVLRRHLQPHGINIGLNLGTAAGAGIADHLHFHVVTRWQGDHNFMTVCAEVRTIPQHIENTFAQLAPDFLSLCT